MNHDEWRQAWQEMADAYDAQKQHVIRHGRLWQPPAAPSTPATTPEQRVNEMAEDILASNKRARQAKEDMQRYEDERAMAEQLAEIRELAEITR